MKLSVRQLKHIIRKSILQEHSIIDGPYEPHVNQKNHAQAMNRLRRDAMEFAGTVGPDQVLNNMERKGQREFVAMCRQELEGPNIGRLDNEEIFVECCVEYCHGMSEKQINRFVASMYS